MRITIARKTQNNPAPAVTEKLLSTQQAMIERGKTELYSNGEDVNIHNLSMPLQSLIKTGEIVEVQDTDQGEVWRAKNTATSISISANGINQTTSLERPL